MKIGSFEIKPLLLLLVFIPFTFVGKFLHWNEVLLFVLAAISIIPLAGLMGESTEHLSHKVGSGIGGLLNATFGNAAELIIAILALSKGLHDVVKASITGSIIGNILLVLGLSIFAGGLKFPSQKFNKITGSLNVTMLALSVVGLLVPAVFLAVVGNSGLAIEQTLSLDISVILMISYILLLVFSLKTHKHLYNDAEGAEEAHHGEVWTTKRSIITLVVATIGTALVAEVLIGAVEHTAQVWGMSSIFVGVVVVAIIGNAAEHSTAILVAMKNKMDLAITIAVGSSIQIALFVAPLLVFLSYLFGKPMDLYFTTFETISIIVTVWILSLIVQDGETNWMEGILCLAVYAILCMAFYLLPH